MMFRNKKGILAASSVCAILLVAGLAACAPQPNDSGSKESQIMPQQDEYGVVIAEEWAQLYPNELETYRMNADNSPDSGKHDYLELYPALNTMYKGYAFALGYDEAASHLYTLESVKNTPRTKQKEQLANCITCKTPQFTALVNSEGDSVYTGKFNDVIDQFTEPISCYNCHENDPTEVRVTGRYFVKAMGNDADRVPVEAQVCGQCHNEYYFDPDTKVTSNPYVGLAAMTPTAILHYYDEMGFKDWEHPDTGAAMIKVQHPEFETMYGGIHLTHMAEMGYSCADCHMGNKLVAEDGTEYRSHNWRSPLENDELISSTCSTCHEDLRSEIKAIQDASEERVHSISHKIEDFINKVAEQRAAGTLAGDDLAYAQKLHRTAQFYWDFVMVENSEGVHNPELADATLDKAEAAVDEGLALVS